MRKTIFTLLSVAVFSITGCGRSFQQTESSLEPSNSSSIVSSSLSILEESSVSEKSKSSLQYQAEQITDCFVRYALSPELRREMIEVTDLSILKESPNAINAISNFLLAAWHYSDEGDFPFTKLAHLTPDEETISVSNSEAKMVIEQLFDYPDWDSLWISTYYHEEPDLTEIPLELCRYAFYGYEEMESLINPDGSISVTLQLIDDPSFPGVDWYGKYRFDFVSCSNEDEIFLRLSACGREQPPDPDKHAALNLKEPPLTYSAKTSPPPSFLDEEQQYLYLRAKTIYTAIRSSTTNIDVQFPLDDQSYSLDFKSVTDDNYPFRYIISTGRYRQWKDFEAMMESIFTKEYFITLTGKKSKYPIFFEKDGLLCYQDVTAGSRWGYQTPDEYNLLEKTESTISFEVIGHYESHDNEGEIETEAFPILMRKTEEGWRIERFAAPMIEP